MSAAYIEHRPKSTDKDAATTHHAVVLQGGDEVHIARERHMWDRDKPDH